VENGELVGRGPTTSHLYSTRGDYANFHLIAEVMLNSKGNSGIFFRCEDRPTVPSRVDPQLKAPRGCEMEIAFQSQGWPMGSLAAGSQATPSAVKDVPPDEWMTLEIIARGRRMTTKINGQTAVDVTAPDNIAKRGHLALQVWTPQTVVHFRKIEIKELPPEEPGWVQLFNGADLTGWVANDDFGNWKAAGGELVG